MESLMDAAKGLKKPAKMGLGRGLSALVSTATPVSVTQQTTPAVRTEPSNTNDVLQSGSSAAVKFVALSQLQANPSQPRTDFSEQEIAELAESIKTLGLLQPILVRSHAGGYQIIAGERRYRAAAKAGLAQVPVIIKSLDDRETLEVAIVENVQRQNLNPFEEAKGYQRLMDEFALTSQEVADRVGKDRATVSNLTRILKLPPVVQEMVRDGRISVGHAKAILTVKEPVAQISLANKVISENLSVRALESIVSRDVVLDSPRKAEKGATKRNLISPHPELEERLRNALGTKVSIHRSARGGSIELHFFSEGELDRLVDILSSNRE
jgi:ParB family chromosome partitioning protein